MEDLKGRKLLECETGVMLSSPEVSGGLRVEQGALSTAQGTEMLQHTSGTIYQGTAGEAYPAHFHEVCDHDDAS